MSTDPIERLFSGVILKVVVVMLLFAVAEIVGFFAARQLSVKRQARQAIAQLIALVMFFMSTYLLVLSRHAVV